QTITIGLNNITSHCLSAWDAARIVSIHSQRWPSAADIPKVFARANTRRRGSKAACESIDPKEADRPMMMLEYAGKRLLAAAGVPVAHGTVIERTAALDQALSAITAFPV